MSVESKGTSKRLSKRLPCEWFFYLGLAVTWLAAGIHTTLSVTRLVDVYCRVRTKEVVIVDLDPAMVMMQLRISTALLIGAVSLLCRRTSYAVLSMLALSWAAVEFVGWYFMSRQIKLHAGIDVFPAKIPHSWGLYGAEHWDVLVFVLAMAGLACEITRFVCSVGPAARR